jgi:RimJ/RimL family protein N-acetyltransferase
MKSTRASPDVVLRPVVAQDAPLLLRIYADTRADELALTDWDESRREQFVRMQFDAQNAHYTRHFPGSSHHIIVLRDFRETSEIGPDSGRDIGRLWLDERDDALHILDISLVTDARGKGIATRMLRDLAQRAHGGGRRLSIFVEWPNAARRLYERLGFVAVGQAQGIHQLMTWPAPARADRLTEPQGELQRAIEENA